MLADPVFSMSVKMSDRMSRASTACSEDMNQMGGASIQIMPKKCMEDHTGNCNNRFNNCNSIRPTHKMLTKLFNWLFSLCWTYNMDSEAVSLLISIINNYVEVRSIDRDQLQCLGIMSFHLASKYTGQRKKLKIPELVALCKDKYSAEHLCQMEANILQTLDFNLQIESTYRVLHCFMSELSKLQPEDTIKLHFLLEAQRLLMDNIGLTKKEVVQNILVFVSHGFCSDFVRRLSKIIKETPYKTVCNRYKSMFDVDNFLENILP